jgi:5'(3')-deoxyribonucleotidase
MRILVDLDDVLSEFTRNWLILHNYRCDQKHLVFEDFNAWNPRDVCTCNMFADFDNADLWKNQTPQVDSIKVTKSWVKRGHDLVVVSNVVNNESASLKLEWLDMFFPHIKQVMLTQGHIKHFIEADVLIDDAYHNHQFFKGIRILRDRPWNTQYELPRAKNWLELDKMIGYLEGEQIHSWNYKSLEQMLLLRYPQQD